VSIPAQTAAKFSASWKTRLRYFVIYLIDTAVLLVPSGRRRRSVLLVRLDNIGDFTLWLDSARRLASYYRSQGYVVTLLASSAWSEWARSLNIFNRVQSLDRKRFGFSAWFRFRTEVALRRQGFSVAVLASYSHDWFSGDTILRTCAAKERIASSGDPDFGQSFERRLRHQWFTRVIPAATELQHELVRNAQLTDAIIGDQVPAHFADLRSASHAAGEALITKFNLHPPFYIVAPSSSEAIKCWPIERFAEMVQRIHQHTGWIAIVTGSSSDRHLGDTISRLSGTSILNLAGETSLMELTGLLAQSQMLLTNDTATTHMGACVGTPTVCILGGGHPVRFLPYPEGTKRGPMVAVTHLMPCFHCGWHCVFQRKQGEPAPCITEVTADAVWKAIQTLNTL
jgi:ADP-heptose:LPS heptosyltransferase